MLDHLSAAVPSNSQLNKTPAPQGVLSGKGPKLPSDFKTAYNKLANQLIKKALIDQESAGRETLLINERDVIEYEK
jgi:hypothetical protein